MKGKVHSFESFGAVDGPGIRFIVFLQGCHLQCKYCHNRDTWDENAGEWYDTDEIIEKALRVKPYMDFSDGGGITVSGGEPLLQVPFVTEIFKKAKEKKMSTCLDTAGSLEITDDIKKLLSLTDTVLLDIKHIDEEKCIRLTGHSNKNELNFARYCSDNGINMWIRQVLVPTYTDDETDLINTRKFIDTLKNVKKVEVLPYHDLGKSKWYEMGLKYPLEGLRLPTIEEIKKAKQILEK